MNRKERERHSAPHSDSILLWLFCSLAHTLGSRQRKSRTSRREAARASAAHCKCTTKTFKAIWFGDVNSHRGFCPCDKITHPHHALASSTDDDEGRTFREEGGGGVTLCASQCFPKSSNNVALFSSDPLARVCICVCVIALTQCGANNE